MARFHIFFMLATVMSNSGAQTLLLGVAIFPT
ncbi:hypothetical protein O199_0226285 [Escherichia coli ATCC 35150]|nr:hypothetical protein O199_0226285 [Escherichia coli ATCC 35150]